MIIGTIYSCHGLQAVESKSFIRGFSQTFREMVFKTFLPKTHHILRIKNHASFIT